MKEIITWNDFEKIDVRVGTVINSDIVLIQPKKVVRNGSKMGWSSIHFFKCEMQNLIAKTSEKKYQAK